MNPLENEAVVQFVVDLLGEYIELEAFEQPGIQMREGLTEW